MVLATADDSAGIAARSFALCALAGDGSRGTNRKHRLALHDIYLFYGATFLGFGLLLAFQARLPLTILPRRALWCLAGFGVLHGLSEWAQMEVLDPGSGHDSVLMRQAGLSLGVLSFALLLQFAAMVLAARRQWPRWVLAVPSVVCVAWVASAATVFGSDMDGVSLSSLEAASRYAFALPASLFAAWAFCVLRPGSRERDRIARYLGWASGTFIAYALFSGVLVGPAPFFPATHVHSGLFRAVTTLPVEIVRMGCAASMAFCLSEVFVIQSARERAELERRREEFISIVAHDLRSPIGVIDMGAELLQRHLDGIDGVDQPRATKYLRNIKTSAHGLGRMVQDLLDSSRIETNMLALEMRAVELGSMVSGVLDRASDMTRGHAVRRLLPESLPMALADPLRVEQILVNLLSNAAKYSEPASEITVEASVHPTEVELAVTNRGSGLSREEIGKAFSRFYRSKKHARQIDGLGLGLYIVKGLVEAQGGRIWVDSELGRFATFRFTLLRADTPHNFVKAATARGTASPNLAHDGRDSSAGH